MADNFIDKSLSNFNVLTKKPEKFLSEPHALIDPTKKLLKENYDFLKKEETDKTVDTLKELIIEDFDVEQIWQQVELQNTKLIDVSLLRISRLVAAKDSLWFEMDIKDSVQHSSEIDDIENSSEIDDIENEKSDADSESENDDIVSENAQNDEFDNVEQSDDVDWEKNKSNKTNNIKKFKSSVVDDDFFNLDEMEQFLKQEESGKAKKKIKHTEDSESDDDSIDLFKSDIDDESDDESKSNPKYSDFFEKNIDDIKNIDEGDIEDNNEESDDSELELSDLDIGNKDENEEIIGKEEIVENEDKSESEEEKEEVFKSNLEIREERLKKKIEQIEESALQEKSWQLKGEITASNRPQNSLLEEVVEFDLTTRPAPVITQETTYKLEDLIKQRMKDKAFDSVERKIKPVEAPMEYKKKLVLDQEKSKQSLAQIYETEYLKQKDALDPDAADKEEEEPKEHIEIKSLMKSLFSKLDALSNFHFTPKQVVPELKIVNNLPAINMEEVAPLAVSNAALLAPEEIKNKPKGDILGKGERTKTDKKRERRKKKKKQQVHAIVQQKKENSVDSKPGKLNKDKANNLIAKVTRDRNVSKMNENSKAVKSSTAFFTQLEEEVKGHINSKIKRKPSTDKTQLVAKKMKL